MASIMKRGDSYSVRYKYKDHSGKPCEGWESFKTKKEAQERKITVEKELLDGTFLVPDTMTVEEMLYKWIPIQSTKHKWSPKTYTQSVAMVQNLIVPYIGKRKVQELRTYDIEQFYATLSQTPCGQYVHGEKQELTENQKKRLLSSTSIHEVHTLLKTAFSYAVEWDLIHKIPLPRDAPKVNIEERTIWDEKTMLAALQTIENPALHLAVHMSMILSLREGEILGLQPSDLDFDTYSNRCFLISKDLLHHGVSEEVYHKMLDSDETDSNKSSEEVTFILTITYKCNMHCTYCYQQNDKTLEKKLISDETLDKILSIIAQYMEANPNKTVRLGLFGGEPLLIENEKVIDKILQFCKEHKTTVHITTNGSFLSYYLKKFIINRRFISGIYPTIDSMALNYMTRYDLDPSRNNTNETFKLLCCIKTLLHYGIHVDLGTNIDRHNHKEIWNTLDDLKKLQLLQDKNFAWTIGRVDDRLYETNFPDIMMESEILAELQSKPLPDNVHAAFLKTCYNFADKMGLKLNLREHKQTHSYCWSTSSSSNVFYVDMNLKTYRCTCTVGRSRYSLFDFSYENLTNYRPVAVTCNSYAECKDCKIGGFCGGGCQLSHQIDFKKCCTYEEEVFSHFMKTLFIPYIKSKYNEVNQNERKAENRCT